MIGDGEGEEKRALQRDRNLNETQYEKIRERKLSLLAIVIPSPDGGGNVVIKLDDSQSIQSSGRCV